MKTNIIKQRCLHLYEADGMSAVIDFCNSIKYNKYGYCSQCETDVPTLKNECLVCGTTISKSVKQRRNLT